ncbi:MAG: sigma-70 family RNA polymerase sigma factor [Gammaproteobacteria bacterium]|nr:MAG: sigma-70 family RNA polymerase sigma factor [Gammaproteobacteria bacterium]
MAEPSDRELVQQFQGGDEQAFELLMQRHQDRVYRLASVRLYAHDDARDAAQEVFLRAYRGLPRFRFQAEPFTWFYRTMINVCNEYNRKRTRDRDLKQEIENDPMAGNEEYIAPDNGPMMQIRQYVQVLPERQREVVMLRIFEDMSVEDTARVLGCRPGTVKAHLHKAIARLKEMAGDQAANGGSGYAE